MADHEITAARVDFTHAIKYVGVYVRFVPDAIDAMDWPQFDRETDSMEPTSGSLRCGCFCNAIRVRRVKGLRLVCLRELAS
jgi:hypothetical protein